MDNFSPTLATPQANNVDVYSLTAEWRPTAALPYFFLGGTGDVRAMAAHTGLVFDSAVNRYRAPTPYHAHLLWCYADEAADRALKGLFPKYTRPLRPRRVPYVMATNDRVICLTTPETEVHAKSAGFTLHESGFFWETRDLRRVIALEKFAENDLRIRLKSLDALPFGSLEDVTIADLISLPPPDEGDGDDSDSVGKEKEEEKPVLEFDEVRGLYVCWHREARTAGFLHAGGGQYVSKDFEHAQRMRLFATDATELRLQAEALIRAVPDPHKSDPRPVPTSPTAPFPFAPDQLEGVRFACTRRGCLIADEMGVGKTCEAIGIINVERPRLALVLAPAGLLDNWMIECGKWLAPPNVAAIFGRSKDRSSLPPGANVVIVGYEMLSRLILLRNLSPDILICDEAQEIKNEDCKAGREVYGFIAPKAAKIVFLTGTPIWNRPQDLWAPLHAIAPDVFLHRTNFMSLYQVSNPERVSLVQQQRLDYLANMLKSGLMIRRLKAEVLNLPPKEHFLVPVRLKDDVLARLRDRSSRVEQLEGEVNSGAETKRKTLFTELARLRREVGEAKYAFVLDAVMSFLSDHPRPPTIPTPGIKEPLPAPLPRPPVIYGRHRNLLRKMADDIVKAGYTVELLTGESTPRARQNRVAAFQEGRSDSVVGGYDAAGTGITLIRACDFFVFEIDYTPSLMKQAIDRLHRRGQDRVCRIFWFVVDGTIDARIAKLFVEKDRVAQLALGDNLVGMFKQADLLLHPVFTDPAEES